MRKFKLNREGSKKFISSVLALQLVLGALALSSCSDKEVEETETETSYESAAEDQSYVEDPQMAAEDAAAYAAAEKAAADKEPFGM